MKVIPVAWQHETEVRLDRLRQSDLMPLRLERIVGFDGVTYAIRQGSLCLNKQGTWEYEPIPSSRTQAFLDRCRWKSFKRAFALFSEMDPKGRLSE